MSGSGMGKFWDARAKEDAYFFIDNRRSFGDRELESFWAGGETDLDQILNLLGASVAPTDVALDIGCGVGRLSRVLAGRGRQVYGLDVSLEMIERARALNRDLDNVQWIHGDGTTLAPLPDTSIDACVSHVVFQHIPDPQITYGYVREIGRVLKPRAWAAFQVSNDPALHLKRRAGVWERLGVAAGRRPGGQDDPSWLGSAVQLNELRSAADAGGLELERIIGEGTQYCLVLARHR